MKIIHDEIITIIKSKTPQEENPANTLMDILSISREGAYRRMRGDILLTLDEVIVIAKKLEISLDNLIEVHMKKKNPFHISPYTLNSSLKEYTTTLKEIMDSYNFIKTDPLSLNFIVCRLPSPVFYFKYLEFSKFVVYKWIYLMLGYPESVSFSFIHLPSKLKQLYQPFMDATKQVNTSFIMNDYIFKAFVNDMNYFTATRLLTREESDIIIQQALLIINEMEEVAINGHFENGNNVSMYITDIHFDAEYGYIRGNNFEACSIGIYGINFLSCMDSSIIKDQKSWIDSLISYSTLISQDKNESKRTDFFKKQREIINSIR